MNQYKIEMTIELDDSNCTGRSHSSIRGMLGRVLDKEGTDATYPGLKVAGSWAKIVVEEIDAPATEVAVCVNARITSEHYGEHMVAHVGDEDKQWSLVGLKDGSSYDFELHASIDKLLESLVTPEDWTLISQGDGGPSGTWKGKVDFDGSN